MKGLYFLTQIIVYSNQLYSIQIDNTGIHFYNPDICCHMYTYRIFFLNSIILYLPVQAMRGPGERLRQLLNINNPDNSFEYEEGQLERNPTTERTSTSPLNPLNQTGPLATSARRPRISNDAMEPLESPTTTSTLQANGHRLPRPHVSMVQNHRNESTGFIPQLEQDTNLITRQPMMESSHRISGQGYYQQGN